MNSRWDIYIILISKLCNKVTSNKDQKTIFNLNLIDS